LSLGRAQAVLKQQQGGRADEVGAAGLVAEVAHRIAQPVVADQRAREGQPDGRRDHVLPMSDEGDVVGETVGALAADTALEPVLELLVQGRIGQEGVGAQGGRHFGQGCPGEVVIGVDPELGFVFPESPLEAFHDAEVGRGPVFHQRVLPASHGFGHRRFAGQRYRASKRGRRNRTTGKR
jgi:hypothetical protein